MMGICDERHGQLVDGKTISNGIYTGEYIINDERRLCIWSALNPNDTYTWHIGEYPEYYEGVKPWIR